jgi:hypothetical protein
MRTTHPLGATLAALTVVSLGACGGLGGGPAQPSAPPSVIPIYSPPAGATLSNGTRYDIRIEYSGNSGPFHSALAFVRDDGVYSRSLTCGATGGGGDGGAFGIGLTYFNGPNDPLFFAAGRRVNIVVLFSSQNMCSGVDVNSPPVDPSRADLGRRDVAVNWLVGG